MDYLAFGFSDGVGSRSSLSLQNGDQPIERRTSRLWINKLTGRVDDEPAKVQNRSSAVNGPALHWSELHTLLRLREVLVKVVSESPH